MRSKVVLAGAACLALALLAGCHRQAVSPAARGTSGDVAVAVSSNPGPSDAEAASSIVGSNAINPSAAGPGADTGGAGTGGAK